MLRRWGKYPILLLPLQRGPLHGFFHFFMGYFLPVFGFRLKHPHKKIAVMDSAPLNTWFDLLPGPGPEIVPRDKVVKIAYLARFARYARGFRVKAFVGWDKSDRYSKRDLATLRDALREHTSSSAGSVSTRRPQIIILGRDFTPRHYAENLPTRYGTAKRNVPNLKEVVSALSKEWDIELVDGATISPVEMVAKCLSASVLIGQHGAALTNLFFLTPGSHVVEIGWPELADNEFLDMYRKMSHELGLAWQRPILQTDRFSKIDAEDLDLVLRNTIER